MCPVPASAPVSAPFAADRLALLAHLGAQRSSVLAIVADLDEASWRRSVVPSGWTPAGLVEHLGHAERFWSQIVLADRVPPPHWPQDEEGDDAAGFVSSHPISDVLDFYRDQCAQTDEILDGLALDDRPPGVRRPDLPTPVADVRDVILHLAEETARHAGHLDIACELLDGRTGRGVR